MTARNQKRPKKGFTLVQLMVSLGVMGVGAAAFMTMMDWQVRGTQDIVRRGDNNAMIMNIQTALQFADISDCPGVLGIMGSYFDDSTDLAVNQVSDLSGNRLLSTQPGHRDDFEVDGISLNQIPGSKRAWGAGYRHQAELVFDQARRAGSEGHSSADRLFIAPLFLSVFTNTEDEITGCSSGMLESALRLKGEICTEMGGDYDETTNTCTPPRLRADYCDTITAPIHRSDGQINQGPYNLGCPSGGMNPDYTYMHSLEIFRKPKRKFRARIGASDWWVETQYRVTCCDPFRRDPNQGGNQLPPRNQIPVIAGAYYCAGGDYDQPYPSASRCQDNCMPCVLCSGNTADTCNPVTVNPCEDDDGLPVPC